jgi:signal transduction histidine kinase
MKFPAQFRQFFRSSFLGRALAVTLSGVVASLLLVTLVFVLISRSEFQTQLGLRASAIADFAATESQFPMLVGDQEGLGRIAQSVLSNEDVLFVVVSDSSGRTPAKAFRRGVNLADLRAGTVPVLELSRSVAAPLSAALFDWESKRGSSPPLGSIRIGFSMAKQRTLFERAVLSGAGIALVTLILVTAGYVFLLKRLVRPLRALSEFAKDVGEGDLSRRIQTEDQDEVAHVARAFNRMVERLGSTTVSKSYVEDIIRSMGESLMVVDFEGKVRTVNDATCLLLGYQEQELIGLGGDEVVVGTGRERTYRAKDGARIPVLFSAASLRGGAGEVWLAQDITDAKRVEQQLLDAKEAAEEASRAKTLFLANMSHELKTPLNAIIGYGELLDEIAGERGQEDMRQDLQKIQQASKHLRNLLDDVLAVAKMEAGRLELHPTEFDLLATVNEIVNTVQPLAKQNGNAIEIEAPERNARLFTDEIKFRQSLLNLMTNACKFTRQGTVSLVIGCQMQDQVECVKIDVRDSGIGIAPEHMHKLFQEFSQVDPTQARKYGGTGLGLSISQKLCHLMGGNIVAESTPGKGSVFTMTLPVRIS